MNNSNKVSTKCVVRLVVLMPNLNNITMFAFWHGRRAPCSQHGTPARRRRERSKNWSIKSQISRNLKTLNRCAGHLTHLGQQHDAFFVNVFTSTHLVSWYWYPREMRVAFLLFGRNRQPSTRKPGSFLLD